MQQLILFDRKFKQFQTFPDGGYADPTASVAKNLKTGNDTTFMGNWSLSSILQRQDKILMWLNTQQWWTIRL